jgi:uncharacterized membrane protein
MIGFFVGLAIVAFILWLVLTLIGAVLGGLVHLLWAVIILALLIAAWRGLTHRRGTAF